MIAALFTLAWVAIVAICGLWLHVRAVRRTLAGISLRRGIAEGIRADSATTDALRKRYGLGKVA